MVELRELEYFLAVADERSFTRAAHRVHVVQSAVSAAVGRLEKELGQKLFDRTGRQPELTEAGRAVRRHARVLLADVRALRDEVDMLNEGLRGRVTLGTILTTGQLDIAAVISRFHRAHPHVTLHLRRSVGSDEDHVRHVLDGTFDLALLPIPDSVPVGVAVTPVARLQLVLACRTDDPLATARRVRYRDIARRDFIDFPDAWGYSATVDALFTRHDASRAVAFEVVDVASALHLVRSDLGLSFVPAEALDEVDDLVAVDLDAPPVSRRLAVAVPDDRPLPAATRALQRMIVEAADSSDFHAGRPVPVRPRSPA